MLVRLYWQQCDRTQLIDAFWVEATYEEAEELIYPLLSPESIKESKIYAKNGEEFSATLSSTPRSSCFLVSRDANSIKPFFTHYPFSHMWNGYSPFKDLPEHYINTLAQLNNIELPRED